MEIADRWVEGRGTSYDLPPLEVGVGPCSGKWRNNYSEWLNAWTRAKWMDRLISKGHTLQFNSVPPRFNGIVETMLSSKDLQLSLLAELQQLLVKKVIATVPKGEEMQGFYCRYFVVPKKQEG